MSKEVIIDGCNVAECEVLLSNYECMSNYEMIDCDGKITQFDKCKDCPNCYFKQLQRAKAEKRQSQEELQNLWANATAERIKLETENEKLKEEITKLKNEEWDNYYFASCVKSNFEGARGATEQLLKCKTLKDAMYYAKIADMYLHFREDTTKRKIKEKQNKYKQALEDIKNLLYTAENTTNGDLYFELVSKAYMKCNEVLDD